MAAFQSYISRDMTREARGAIIWDMKRNQKKTDSEIGEIFDLSRVRISQEFKFYISTEEGKIRETSYQTERQARLAEQEKARKLEKEARIARRNERAVRIINELIDGKTVKEVAEEENRTVCRIHGIINQYEKIDPDLVKKYRKVAATHKFGWYRNEQKNDKSELVETVA